MTSQKTIERCRARIKELEEGNAALLEGSATLLKNNEMLAAANKRLRVEIDDNTGIIETLKAKNNQCRQKCEIAISEKDRILQEREQILQRKEAYIKGLHDTIWHLQHSFVCSTYGFHDTPNGFKLVLDFNKK